MAYQQEISLQHRALWVFLLQQSASMREKLTEGCEPKMEVLATAVNGWLQNMVIRCSAGHGIKDWMDVAIIGYRTGADGSPIIESPLVGLLRGRDVISIAEIGQYPARMAQRAQTYFDDDTGESIETIVEVPVWLEPIGEGSAPMCRALAKTCEVVGAWVQRHERSFPPIVVHFSDGEHDDGDPFPYADSLRSLATQDGEVLLFHCYLARGECDPLRFPGSGDRLPDESARLLWEMSSFLPDPMHQNLLADGFGLEPAARGMAVNASMIDVLKSLDMGTRVARDLR
jgi:hypothetical protein